MKKDFIVKTALLTGLLISTACLPVFAQQPNVTPIKDDIVAQTPADEAKVTNTVKELLHSSKNLSKLNLGVTTSKGVVTFEGTVDSDSQIISLIELAESVVGVSDVNTSKLTVTEGKQPIADSITTAKIKGILIREKLFGEKDLPVIDTQIETKDGVVYITGTVDNEKQVHNAIELIKKHVPEVKKVEYSVKKITRSN